MKKAGYKRLVEYWQKTAEYDYDTMKSLVKSKRYTSSLFFGHIILEKILKALVAQETKDHAPYTHNLFRLAEISRADLSKKEMNFLKEVNEFNMEARYPEAKLDFYKICTKDFCLKYIKEIDALYKKICQKLK